MQLEEIDILHKMHVVAIKIWFRMQKYHSSWKLFDHNSCSTLNRSLELLSYRQMAHRFNLHIGITKENKNICQLGVLLIKYVQIREVKCKLEVAILSLGIE